MSLADKAAEAMKLSGPNLFLSFARLGKTAMTHIMFDKHMCHLQMLNNAMHPRREIFSTTFNPFSKHFMEVFQNDLRQTQRH